MLAADGKCAVSVTAPASTAWAADVDLGADLGAVTVVKGLLVHMQRAGMLRKVEAPPPEVQEKATLPVKVGMVQTVPQTVLEPLLPAPATPRQAPALPQTPPVPFDDATPSPLYIPTDARGSEVVHELRDLQELSLSGPKERRAQKDAALQREHPDALSLSGLHCDRDPAWTCALLQTLGPRLVVLGVVDLQVEHATTLRFMPRLKSLSLKYDQSSDPTTGVLGRLLPEPLLELKLDVPLRDVAYWIRKCPAEFVDIALSDSVSDSDPCVSQTRHALCQSAQWLPKGRMCQVTLVREVVPARRPMHTALCEKQRSRFWVEGWIPPSCSACSARDLAILQKHYLEFQTFKN